MWLQVEQDCSQLNKMMVAFAEQNYDIMYEINEQLLSFCQVSFNNFNILSFLYYIFSFEYSSTLVHSKQVPCVVETYMHNKGRSS